MKKALILMSCIGCLVYGSPTVAQNSEITIQSEESQNLFTSLFKTVWAQLNAINPQTNTEARSQQVATAGIRGSESTESLLKLYWKGDLTRDQQFQTELESYNVAMNSMNQGQLDKALKSFDAFLDRYANSDLRPNAILGKGISLAGLGQQKESLIEMQQFVVEFPQHPLTPEAQKVIDQLHSGNWANVLAPDSQDS